MPFSRAATAISPACPAPFLKPFINYVIDSDALDYVGAASEGEAMGVSLGSHRGLSQGESDTSVWRFYLDAMGLGKSPARERKM